MAAKKVFNLMKSELQEALELSKKELAEGRDELLSLAKRTSSKVKGGQQLQEEQFPSYVNVDVGDAVLMHFLLARGAIREQTRVTAQKALEADVILQKVAKKCASWSYLMEKCDVEFRCLPDLLKSVHTVTERVDAIALQLEEVQGAMSQLELLNAKLDNERKKHSAFLQFEAYKKDKENEKAALETTIASEKVRLEETKKEAVLKQAADRQQTLQEMFDEEVKEFVSKGVLHRSSSIASSTKSIEDIEIDDTEGQQSLTDFLDDVSPLDSPPLVVEQEGDEPEVTEPTDTSAGVSKAVEDSDTEVLQEGNEVKDEKEETTLKQD